MPQPPRSSDGRTAGTRLAPRDTIVTARGGSRLAAGHPWVYRSDVRSLPNEPGWSRLLDERGHPLGWAAVNPTSQIAVRRFHDLDEPVTVDDVVRRLEAAIDARTSWLAEGDDVDGPHRPVTGYRLVHAEADGLPGLVVDRLGNAVVVRNGCAAMETFLSAIVDTLVHRIDPEHVVLRHDGQERVREGLPVQVAAAYGTLPRTATYDDGVLRWHVDPAGGQKTGAYLDQRVNHRLLGARARGRGLDLFAHHGGFGLHLLAGGAADVHLVDTSAHALEGALAAAKENGLPMPSVHRGDAAQHLRGLLRRGEQFDVISVDPPAFAKRARDLPRAEAAYKDVQLHAMRLLRPGGILAASSCSFHLSEPAFMNVLTDAATDAGRTFHVVERRGAAPDHVERLGFPESAYLKFVILQAVQG